MSTNLDTRRAPVRMFGVSREARPPGAPLNVTSETTAWEIYNNRASVVDRELIKDWNDSLNSLLIFAALYSTVLTAFIIESMKLLREDPTETTRDILLSVSRQLANASTASANVYQPTNFAPEDFAVRVNVFFFISISASLIAALGAVLALQWVGSYDAGLHPSSAEDRALQRHFRHKGVEDWKMVEIIAALPALIFLALLLFSIGLADWMLHVHTGIAAVVITGLIIGTIFFIITTIISMVYVGAPFRTPASRAIPTFLRRLYRVLVRLPTKKTWIHFIALLNRIKESFKRLYTSIGSQWTWLHLKTNLDRLVTIMKPSEETTSFDVREKSAINAIPNIKLTSLLWLAKTIDVVRYSKPSFLVLIQEILTLPPHQLVDSAANDAPWNDIFMLLCKDYFGRKSRDAFSAEELEAVTFLLRGIASIGGGYCATPVFNRFFAAIGDGYGDYATNYADLSRWKHWYRVEELERPQRLALGSSRSRLAELNLREICESIHGRPFHLVQMALLSHSTLLPPDELKYTEIPSIVASQLASNYGTSLMDITLLPLSTIDIILDSISYYYVLSEEVTGSTTFSRYMSSLRKKLAANTIEADFSRNNALCFHSALQKQLLAQLCQNDGTDERTATSLLTLLVKLFQESLFADSHISIVIPAFSAILQTNIDVWDVPYRRLTANFVAAVLAVPSYDVVNDWTVWWTELLEGLDVLIHDPRFAQAPDCDIISDFALEFMNRDIDLSTRTEKLLIRREAIRHPFLSLLAASSSPNTGNFKFPLLEKDWKESRWSKAASLWCGYRQKYDDISSKDLGFICEVLDKLPYDALENVTEIFHFSLLKCKPPIDYGPVLDVFFNFICLKGSLLFPYRLTLPLLKLCAHPSFVSKFIGSGTYEWVPNDEFDANYWTHSIHKCMARFLVSAASGDDLDERMQYVYGYLQLPSSVLDPSNHQLANLRHNPSSIIRALRHILHEQGKHRRRQGEETINSLALTLEDVDDEIIPESFYLLEHQYAEGWAVDKWDEWLTLVDAVISGFSRGRIPVGLAIESSRFGRDPDGLCMCPMVG